MKKLIDHGTVDCAECSFGYNGDGSCGEGRSIKDKGMQGCGRGRALRKASTPLKDYKQTMMAGMRSGAGERNV